MRPPWFFCCGWWSPWCVLDVLAHKVGVRWRAVCDRHDAAMLGYTLEQLRAYDSSNDAAIEIAFATSSSMKFWPNASNSSGVKFREKP